MLFKRIGKSSPEQVFLIVYNVNSSAVSVGHGVFFYYTGSQSGGTAATGSGYQISVAGTGTTFLPNPSRFAGVVAGNDIASNDYGTIQVWGHNTFIVCRASTHTNAQWVDDGSDTDHSLRFYSRILKPLGIYGQTINEGADSSLGYFGMLQVNSISTDPVGGIGGYAIPVDGFYTYTGPTDIGTALVNYSNNSTVCCKGFIKAL